VERGERGCEEVKLDPMIDYKGEKPQSVEEIKTIVLGGG